MASTVKQPGHTMTRGSITISTAVLGKNVADMIYMKLRGFKQFRIATYLGMKISRILRLQIILGFPVVELPMTVRGSAYITHIQLTAGAVETMVFERLY